MRFQTIDPFALEIHQDPVSLRPRDGRPSAVPRRIRDPVKLDERSSRGDPFGLDQDNAGMRRDMPTKLYDGGAGRAGAQLATDRSRVVFTVSQ
jgi:hypothetical protein